jgi:type I restriction enzyme S subunit
VKADWVTKPLGELCRIEIGGTPPRGQSKFWDEKKTSNNVWLSIADMPKGLHARISSSAEHVSDEGAKRVKVVKAGTLLVSFKLTLGRLAYAGIDLRTNEAIAALALIDEKSLSKEFLYWYLTFFDWQKAAEGEDKIKGKTLNKAKLAVLPVLVPPLPEQQRIVAILDEAFAGLATATANAEKNLKNARELFESYLNSIFTKDDIGWLQKRLEELGRLQTGTTPKTSEAGNTGNFIPFIKPGDFRADGSLDYGNEGLSEKGLQSSRLIPADSAAMVCIGATIGKSGYVARDVAANQQVNAVTPNKGISAKFLYYQMITSRFQSAVRANAGQATLPIISKGKWGALTMAVPPTLDEQRAIVSKLDGLLAMSIGSTEIYQAKLEKLADLKQSILQKAFSGELTSPPSRAIKEAAE